MLVNGPTKKIGPDFQFDDISIDLNGACAFFYRKSCFFLCSLVGNAIFYQWVYVLPFAASWCNSATLRLIK